jgi:hypothetical protein
MNKITILEDDLGWKKVWDSLNDETAFETFEEAEEYIADMADDYEYLLVSIGDIIYLYEKKLDIKP